MDVRLAVPSLLMTVALFLTGAVDAALRPDGGFALSPRQGSFALASLSGPLGESPSLEWGEPPEGTISFVLVAEDLDAPAEERFLWALWGIPADSRSIDGGMPRVTATPGGMKQAVAFDGRPGFAAPEISSALRHRLRFTLFALDRPLALSTDAIGAEVLVAATSSMRGAAHWHAGGGWAAERRTAR